MKRNNQNYGITDRNFIGLRLSQIRFTTRLKAPDLEYRISNLENLIKLLESDKFYESK